MNRLTIPVAALVAAGSLAACTSGSNPGNAHKDVLTGGTYVTALPSDPGNLHPLRAQQVTTNNVVGLTYDTLLDDTTAGKLVPQLATTWRVTPTSVTYTLRKGVTCSDGTALTAGAVAANFDWIKNPKNGSSYLGSNLPDSDYTVRSDDTAGTVTISRTKPYGFLLDGTGLIPIVCPKGLSNPKLLAQGTDGTGPYVVSSYKADDQITLKVRSDYRWGPNGAGTDVAGVPARIVLRIIKDSSTQINLFLAGQLNDASATGPDEARLKGHGFQTLAVPTGPAELFFNQRNPALRDPRVRKALTTALDLDTLTKVLTDRTGQRATSLTQLEPRPCTADDTSGVLPAFDQGAAAALLDQAGWTKGADGTRRKNGQALSLTVGYPSGTAETDAAMELVDQEWHDLGVTVRLRGQGSDAFVQTLFGGGHWDVALLSVNIYYPNSFVAYASGAVPPAGQNFAAIHNAEYERLTAQALSTPGSAGCDLWSQAERSLFANLDVVPIATTVGNTYLRGVSYSPSLDGVDPTSIRLYKQ